MINEKSLAAVKNSPFEEVFCKPLYSSYCFSNIPQTIFSLFDGSKRGLPEDCYLQGMYDQVVLLFLDGFGWHFYEKYKTKIPLLKRLENEGILSKITSMFPSTTAAHITCIHTDLTPIQSGIYEWFMYEPILDEIIAPLPFTYAGEHKIDNLPLDPDSLFPRETIYQKLADREIRSHIFQSESISHSICTKSNTKGAELHGFRTPKDGLEKMLTFIKPQTYCYFYYGEIDAIGHRKGIYSKEFAETIVEIFSDLENFYQKLPPKTALLITADHGMTPVDPETTYYLNKKIPNIEKHFLYGKRGKPLAPAGSCRDYFCHVQPEQLSEFAEILSYFLEEKASVHRTSEFIEQGFFGPHLPTEHFLSRVGNLVILPYKGEAIWWFEKRRFAQNFYAAHGGLTPEEMETIFLFSPIH